MRQLALVILAGLIAVAIWLWGFGGADRIGLWATTTQREVQNAMAASLRALRAEEPGALLGLWGLCFTYGFVHAAGPGHGKLVVGGYGIASRASLRKLVALAMASSLAQAIMAILFVTVGLTALGWGRERLTLLADQTMAGLSYGMIVAVGLWLIVRALRRMLHKPVHHHDHHHSHEDGVCATCGHVHAPTPEQAHQAKGWRDMAILIAAIAIRPCTGAVFLLILTFALDIYLAGVIGTLVMGLGTAALTGAVALVSVGARESAVLQAASSQATARLMTLAELAAGVTIALLAGQFLLRTI